MTTSFSLFRDKVFYKDVLYPTEDLGGNLFPKPIDFWYQIMLYGRVDERQDAVYISATDETDFRRFKQVDPTSNIIALNFVADAFLSFQRKFLKASAGNLLHSNSFIKRLKPTRAYIDVNKLYRAYIENLSDIFINSFLSVPKHGEEVENFDDFLYKFLEFVRSYSRLLPITKSSFIKSKYCTPLISGLIIELKNENHDDDKKREKWLNDLNYEFYVKTAKSAGFLVDKNAPWRLVANIT